MFKDSVYFIGRRAKTKWHVGLNTKPGYATGVKYSEGVYTTHSYSVPKRVANQTPGWGTLTATAVRRSYKPRGQT